MVFHHTSNLHRNLFLNDEPIIIRRTSTQMTILFPTSSAGRKADFPKPNDTYRRFNIHRVKRSHPERTDNEKSKTLVYRTLHGKSITRN